MFLTQWEQLVLINALLATALIGAFIAALVKLDELDGELAHFSQSQLN